ncbi:polysaccharide deacetylase family protein [Roseibium sp. LAB1]
MSALEKRHGIRLAVTFDDGNLSDFEIGLPALVEAGRSARFFVLAGRIGAQGYLSADQMRQILAAGSSIGCHGFDHVDWRTLDTDGFQREIVDARRKIEDVAGQEVSEAAIPFGAFNSRVLHELKAAGYRRVFTSTSGLAYDDAWFSPRWSVTDSFDPDRDVGPRVGSKQKFESSLYALARRFRYRI